MRASNVRIFLSSLAAALIIIRATGLGPDPAAVIPLPASAVSLEKSGPPLVLETALQVVASRPRRILDHCFISELDQNRPPVPGENALVAAALKRDWDVVRRLIEAGASVETADETG
ncbi:MAG TPA: hypothetical protein VGI42_02055, partial [Chthoniobacterales bacterium]